jgi:uncharacterized protein (TIGR02646 family)
MTPFPRQLAPSFWGDKERAWLEKVDLLSANTALHGWSYQGRSLAFWFHQLVRPLREPRLCAYCDGELGATSPPNIEHFVPVSRDRTLGLCWSNLFPTCTTCNTTYKRDAWVPEMVRPDRDWVVGWFAVNWKGEVEASALLDAPTRDRIQKTIDLLGLNDKARCIARRQVFERALELLDALETGPAARRLAKLKRLMKLLRGGPYRFVARQVLGARG